MAVEDPVLALVGPTASGKTAAALQVARQRGDVEVVAVDAFTIYRGMDVGTAKPTADERAEVRHHLVDVLDPTQDVNVAWFQQAARAAIADVHARGRVPLLVGGAGLYFQAVVDELEFPPTDTDVRADLEQRWADDPAGAHQHLASVDEAAAAKIEPDNLRRTVRALEVIELTGRRFSSYARDVAGRPAQYPNLVGVRLDVDPDVLRARIDERAARMVADGLLDECRRLADGPALSRTARQAIGYAEGLAVLAGELDVADLATTVAARTRAYARRQRAWFRRDARLPSAGPDSAVVSLVAAGRAPA